jgi:hypothetical protein
MLIPESFARYWSVVWFAASVAGPDWRTREPTMEHVRHVILAKTPQRYLCVVLACLWLVCTQMPLKTPKAPKAVPAEASDSDVELDGADFQVFEEFGDRVEFLGSLSASSLDKETEKAGKQHGKECKCVLLGSRRWALEFSGAYGDDMFASFCPELL